MPLLDSTLNVGADAMAAVMPYVSIHTALPNSSGSNESTAPRLAAGWTSASAGDLVITNKSFTGGAPSGPAQYLGFWSALTGGTFRGSAPLTGDQSFNAAGEYTVSSLTVNGASS